jgi:hypothetical protein
MPASSIYIGPKKSLLNEKNYSIFYFAVCIVYFFRWLYTQNLCWVCTLTPLSSSCNSKWENSKLSVPFITYDEWRAQSEKGKEKCIFVKIYRKKNTEISRQSWWKIYTSQKGTFWSEKNLHELFHLRKRVNCGKTEYNLFSRSNMRVQAIKSVN